MPNNNKKISILISKLAIDLGNIAIHGSVGKKTLTTKTGKNAITFFSTKEILPSNAKGTLNAMSDKVYRAYNNSKMAAISEYINNDLMEARPTYVTMGDGEVRDSHASADGQKKFSESDIGYLLGSGVETSAPASSGVDEEDYGCRCWENYDTSSEKDEDFNSALAEFYNVK